MPLSGKEMLRRYENNGWSVLRQKGSHVVLGKGAKRQAPSNPYASGVEARA
jgi:predicted RNA binding protein YcfA (HicA-like mRNA interferase family)